MKKLLSLILSLMLLPEPVRFGCGGGNDHAGFLGTHQR